MNKPTYDVARAAQIAVATIQDKTVRSVVKYVSPKLVVKVTRKQKPSYSDKYHVEFILSIGRPNHAERKLVKLFLNAGEPFPLKRPQIKWYDQ